MSKSHIPVTVLTGFLGSGKTTILSKLIRDPAFSDTAVIVNEFGEVGLDHMLVSSSDETIIDLSCGCICCTIRGDLMLTLSDLKERREQGTVSPFARVVIETTGLADPAPIIHTLMQEPTVFTSYRLAQIVTVVDTVNGMTTLDRHPEAVKQVAVADGLLMTKTDIVQDVDAMDALDTRINHINPSAHREECVNGRVPPSFLFTGGVYDPENKGTDFVDWLSGETEGLPNSVLANDRHDDAITTFSISRNEPISRGALGVFMQMLADQKGADLLRMKGLVQLTDDQSKPAVVHGVQHVVHPIERLDAWPTTTRQTILIFIVSGIPVTWIEDLWDTVIESAYAGLRV